MLASLYGCDQGAPRDQPQTVGPVVPVKLLGANVGQDHPLPANGQIELQFDRLLQPISITRQTFVLEDVGATTAFRPTVSYDPAARIVTISPLTDPGEALKPQQSYRLIITTPKSAKDPDGLRAIDGAPLESPATRTIAFSVTEPTPAPPAKVSIDFCRDVHPILQAKCAFPGCHSTASPGVAAGAAGLVLDPPNYITSTAIGRVSQGANTGPRSVAAAPSLLFGEDMPIIDPGGNPSNSWFMYKLFLAAPTAAPPQIDAGVEDAGVRDGGADGAPDASPGDGAGADASPQDGSIGDGAGATGAPMAPPIDVSHTHGFGWGAISDADRQILSNYVLGREMPYPQLGNSALTLDELERISLWIAQGAAVPAQCPNR